MIRKKILEKTLTINPMNINDPMMTKAIVPGWVTFLSFHPNFIWISSPEIRIRLDENDSLRWKIRILCDIHIYKNGCVQWFSLLICKTFWLNNEISGKVYDVLVFQFCAL